MSKSGVLLLGDIVHAKAAWNSLATIADLLFPGVSTRSAFIRKCQAGSFDGVLVIYRTFYSASITRNIDSELIEALSSSLKYICHSGAGYDQIDIGSCSKRGIQVSNVPEAVNDATADTAIFLMLGALRGFKHNILTAQNSQWRGTPQPPLGHDPEGKTLGILGYGGIGRNVARKARAFGMKVIYHNRKPSDSVAEAEAEYTSFEQLLKSSDVISVNLPLNTSTRHLLSSREFDMMKRGVVIINTARGPIIDEEALVIALTSGKVWACGLDVFENEPAVHPGLVAHPRSMLLPHVGTYTLETHTKMEERCIGNVRSALETGGLKDIVPEQRRM